MGLKHRTAPPSEPQPGDKVIVCEFYATCTYVPFPAEIWDPDDPLYCDAGHPMLTIIRYSDWPPRNGTDRGSPVAAQPRRLGGMPGRHGGDKKETAMTMNPDNLGDYSPTPEERLLLLSAGRGDGQLPAILPGDDLRRAERMAERGILEYIAGRYRPTVAAAPLVRRLVAEFEEQGR